jgi:hypothetical protein
LSLDLQPSIPPYGLLFPPAPPLRQDQSFHGSATFSGREHDHRPQDVKQAQRSDEGRERRPNQTMTPSRSLRRWLHALGSAFAVLFGVIFL